MSFFVKVFGSLVLFFSMTLGYCSSWPLWDQFRTLHERDGRIVDWRKEGPVTTSESQSYGLFFALVAGDRPGFTRILDWTEKNLAQGSFEKHLPGWLWGQNKEGHWEVLDKNNASDSDMWIAYALLEAGRIWNNPEWTEKGRQLLALLEKQVRTVPKVGSVVLPGTYGFEKKDSVTVNPSYYPTVILRRFAQENSAWKPVETGTLTAIVRASPDGYAPDWATFSANGDLVPPKDQKGSWDAIRTYLWAGFLPKGDPARERLVRQFENMIRQTEDKGLPPESVEMDTLKTKDKGPVAFGAALLAITGEKNARFLRSLLTEYVPKESAYYKNCLVLFGLGFDQGVFSFAKDGSLRVRQDKPKQVE